LTKVLLGLDSLFFVFFSWSCARRAAGRAYDRADDL